MGLKDLIQDSISGKSNLQSFGISSKTKTNQPGEKGVPFPPGKKAKKCGSF